MRAMDYRIKILLIFPLILIIILVVLANSIRIKGEPFEVERRILEFAPSDIKVKQRQTLYTIISDFKSPIDFSTADSAQVGFPPVALDALAPQPSSAGKEELSLIVIGLKNRMAILNGVVVREGDSINDIKVSKIEPDRVLLENKTIKWVAMEKK